MRVEAAQDKALSEVGYLERKQTGMGYYMDGKQINHESLSFSDVMRMAPGLRISPLGDGRTYVITDSRSASNGCVNFYVDGTLWQTMTPGDIDDYVRPQELVAVEVYHGSQTPPQFTTPGQSSCAAIVAWTVAKVRPDKNTQEAVSRRREIDGCMRPIRVFARTEMSTECDVCGVRFDLVAGGACMRCEAYSARAICTARGCGG